MLAHNSDWIKSGAENKLCISAGVKWCFGTKSYIKTVINLKIYISSCKTANIGY